MTETTPVQGQPRTLVLADDASELRSLIKRLIERGGRLQVIGEADTAAATATLVQDHRPDALLLDLAMPGGGALDLIVQLRGSCPELAIVILSGYPAASSMEQCLELGADRYLEKGCSTSELLETVLEAVSHRRNLRS